jgi:Ca-activated chloride channel homolog
MILKGFFLACFLYFSPREASYQLTRSREKGEAVMKKQSLRSIITVCLCTGILLTSAAGASAAGLLKPISGRSNPIHIKAHHVQVIINNGFSRTEVDQIFVNEGDTDLEALYSFPVPRSASLSELSLWINGKETIGEVLEKERARKIYEDKKARGDDSALAEKDDYKTFTVAVSPVRAGVDTRIRLVYYQPLEIDLNIGRYVYPLAEGGVDEERIAFWSVDDSVQEAFSFNLTLKSAVAVKELRMPGHMNSAVITRQQEGETGGEIYSVRIDSPEGATLSEDIVCYYRLDDTAPARLELIPYKPAPDQDGTFMVVVTPGASLKRISEGTDWTFVLDVSGSMGGNKITTLAKGVSRVLGKMSPADRFRIITFNDSARDFTGGYITATPENVSAAIEKVGQMQAGGGTNLYAGLAQGYKRLDDDRTTGIILVTDGVANIGTTEEAAFLKLLREYDIRLFTFVMGNSANSPLLNKIARESGGFAMNISTADDIVGRIIQAKAKVLHENLHGVELKFHGERVRELTPAKIGNLYLGQQLVMFGKYSNAGPVDIEMQSKISGTDHSWRCSAMLPEADTENPEIERLWALSAIEERMETIRENGEDTALRKEIVDLGTAYSLVTDYTSMVIVTEQDREELGIQGSNKKRVERERQAQQQRATNPVKNYRADNRNNNKGMFNGVSAPGIGSGPIGPLGLVFAFWLRRRQMKPKNH